jgi:hypothetical protein
LAVLTTDLPAAKADFGCDESARVFVGDSFTREFNFQDVTVTPIAQIDFTGFTQVFEVLDENGLVVVTGTALPSPGTASGLIRITLTAAQTTTLGAGRHPYRVTGSDGGANSLTWVCGILELSTC